MVHRCLSTIMCDILPCRILERLHIIWIPQRCFSFIVFLLPFIFPTINSPVSSFSIVVVFSVEAGFCYCFCFCCHFLYWCLPRKMKICGHIWHAGYIRPWITCHSCCFIYFIQRLTLETYLLVQVILYFISFYLFLPEPTYIFLRVFQCHIQYLYITGYSYWIVVFR